MNAKIAKNRRNRKPKTINHRGHEGARRKASGPFRPKMIEEKIFLAPQARVQQNGAHNSRSKSAEGARVLKFKKWITNIV